MTIAITGATGHLGRLTIDNLLKTVPAGEIVAIARDAVKAASLAARGVVVRIADYDRPETLGPALAGVDTLAFISNPDLGKRAAQHAAIVAAAKASAVKLVAYTSILNADTSRISIAATHRATEQALRETGLPVIFLRNGWYMENYTGDLSNALNYGAVNGAAGEGRISAATRADFAEALAVAVTGRAEAGKAYELGGDEAFTLGQLADEISRQSGKPVRYNHLSEADYAKLLESFGLPAPLAADIANWDTQIAAGALFTESGDLRRLIGHPTTTMSQAVAASLAKR